MKTLEDLLELTSSKEIEGEIYFLLHPTYWGCVSIEVRDWDTERVIFSCESTSIDAAYKLIQGFK